MRDRTAKRRKNRKVRMFIHTIGFLISIMLLVTVITLMMDEVKATKLGEVQAAASEEKQELQPEMLIPDQKVHEKQEIDNQAASEEKEGTELEESILDEEGQQPDKSPSTNLVGEESTETMKKVVYLTFDDGPSSSTMELLNVLKEYEMKATFFMLSPYVKQYPDPVRQMVFDGHAVALHGVTHDKKKFYRTPQSPLNEMLESQKTVKAVTGVKTFLIRTPYGSMPYLNSDQRSLLKQNGFKLWDWNVDSEDWKLRDDRYVTNTIQQLERRRLEPSSVILLHEKETTVKYIRHLLNYLSEQGYETHILTEDLESFHYGSY